MKNPMRLITIILVSCYVLLFTACSFNPFNPQEYQQNNSRAEVQFNVAVPTSNIGQSGLFLEILDEVTGLGLNPTRYQMQSVDQVNYSIRIPLTIGLVRLVYFESSSMHLPAGGHHRIPV